MNGSSSVDFGSVLGFLLVIGVGCVALFVVIKFFAWVGNALPRLLKASSQHPGATGLLLILAGGAGGGGLESCHAHPHTHHESDSSEAILWILVVIVAVTGICFLLKAAADRRK